MEANCGYCGVPAKLKCAGCQQVYYCNPDHQKKHWKAKHKHECVKPYELTKSDEIGRHFVATKTIEKDTILFSENPLVIGPKWNLADYEQRSTVVPCVGCFTDCPLGQFYCEFCRWPACKPDCPGLGNSNLHGLECGVLRFGRPPKPGDDPEMFFDYYRYDALLVLKCLALQIRNADLFDQLINLESHYNARKNSRYYADTDERVVSYLFRNFLDPLQKLERKEGKVVLKMCDRKTLHMIGGILEVNAMIIPLSNGREICGLYPMGCLLEHNCMPNSFYTFDCSKGMKLTFKAGRDIQKGEHITTTYTHSLWGTQLRREHLKTNKYFACKCSRCSDPTEFGTFLSALRCMGIENEPCGGFQLPINPLAEDSDWKCNRCPVQITHDQVNFLMSKIGEEVDDVMSRKSSVKEFENLIHKLQNFLHPNHFHLQTLKHSLIQMYGRFPGHRLSELSDEILRTKLKMCHEMLTIIEVLDPESFRLSLYASVILLEQHAALIELHKRQNSLTASNVKDALSEALQSLVRAKNILRNEMGTLQGKKLMEQIESALENVKAQPGTK
ncbi:SET domain-containing protein SmydA-8 [Anopheles gambiae]|uniref:MYND-type domain-containing protein n=1 Tax=Anopheles coluzzii TaxID=1518534 RepID=A0A6E8W2D2_ANOCL|nr:SET domain-containing protein SmydA-8 [Anopheles coluzzii]XP_311564.5 SET domain-containing protein SmydA-8 [Anopheles gambiae]